MTRKLEKALKPIPPRESVYGVATSCVAARAADLPGMVFLKTTDLFPESPKVFWPPENPEEMRRATREALAGVDMSMIKPGDSVNLLGSHHSWTILGGQPYTEMLKTIKEVIEERTGCKDIRLRAGVGLRFRETEEYIKRFGLDKVFGPGKARGMAPIDEGIPIETEIGTLYGIKRAYDATWIVHTHNSDVREIHFHRHVDRAVKPFSMSYARIESRSTYHHNLGPRGANFTARAIFNSKFVQDKWAFACFFKPTPAGIVGVTANNDLYALNREVTALNLATYGKMMTLLGKVKEAIAVLDFCAPVPYVFGGGVIYANFCSANIDLLDLEEPLPSYTWYTESYYGEDEKPLLPETPPMNPAIKACVVNYAWVGYPSVFWAKHTPTIIVGEDHARLFREDSQNIEFPDYAKEVVPDLDTAMSHAYAMAKTDKVIIFDGAGGGINCSQSLAEELLAKAPAVSKEVETTLMPKWLKQRGGAD
jgi:hypothetical protein